MATFSFSAKQLNYAAIYSLEYHMRDKAVWQTIQDKPLLKKIQSQKETFPGGKDDITYVVRATFKDDWVQGYTGADVVQYDNENEGVEARVQWKEFHAGIGITETELKKYGIVVTSSKGIETKDLPGQAKIALRDALADKMGGMAEGVARSWQKMWWGDGSASPKNVPGILYWVQDAPSTPMLVAGIDQGSNVWWRNRALLAIDANLANSSNNNLVRTLVKEDRQLRRFGNGPTDYFCGSDFLDQMQNELRARGDYTNSGWGEKGSIEVGMDDPKLRNKKFQYEPYLDDIGYSKRCYALDLSPNGFKRMQLEGEPTEGVKRSPERPENQYIVYSGLTWTLAARCKQRNTSGVYSIA